MVCRGYAGGARPCRRFTRPTRQLLLIFLPHLANRSSTCLPLNFLPYIPYTDSTRCSAVASDDRTPAATSWAPSPSSSVPSTPLEQTLLLLHSAVFRNDPLLLFNIYQAVADCDGLTNTERTVLLDVLPNMPSGFRVRDSLVRRLLSLSATELRLLASIFQDRLIAVRNWGDRPRAASAPSSATISQ